MNNLGLKCLKCNNVLSGSGGLHLTSKCPECGNADLSSFIRVDDEDINPKAYERDKEWLESRLVK